MGKTFTRPISESSRQPFGASFFTALTGIFLALALWKFGNAVIFESATTAPQNIYELIFQPWPLNWGYGLIAVLGIVGMTVGKLEIKKDSRTVIALLLPVVWLVWQFISATQTVDSSLTRFTLKHFTACVICFYLGWFSLGRIENIRPTLAGLLAGFAIVLWSGWDQHFGGLEQTRQFFYSQPNWRDFPPEFIQKMASTRIYSTLFYPNTLAAVILLVLPICFAGIWSFERRFTKSARIGLMSALGIGALGCLYWSGSKSGWLLALLLGCVALLRTRFNRAFKAGIIIAIFVLGLAGFAVKYAKFFEKGATSVVARTDYWRAALQITAANPVLGTGPGTFFIPYQKIKKPESEITRLCHNDYLEQASDSGLMGFLSFTIFIFGSLIVLYPRDRNFLVFSIWLGLLGVCLHSLVEFNLYIPALAWPVFLFFGWLWGARNQFDKIPAAS
jgi:O-antigen ligase